jgi:thiol-disulfide isomerase/thioredoxin
VVFLLLVAACVPDLTTPGGADAKGGPWVAPDNSWGLCGDGPPDGFEGEGLEEGEVAPDFLLGDQFGASVSLWQFHGCPVVLDLSTMWCAPCRILAGEAQAVVDDYAARNLRYVSVLPQDLGTDPPDTQELYDWGDYYGLSEPILSDDAGYAAQVIFGDRGFPAVLILDEDGVVVDDVEPANDDTIRAALDALP